MPIYQLYYRDYLENVEVSSFVDHEEARRFVDKLPTEFTAYVFEGVSDLGTELPRGPLLLDLYNKITGEAVTRFSDRETGLRRVYDALVKRAIPATATTVKEKRVSEEKTNGEAQVSKPRGRASKFKDEQTITLKVDKNPKNEGSQARDRFGFYRNGMTVREYLNAGGKAADLGFDSKHNYIEIA